MSDQLNLAHVARKKLKKKKLKQTNASAHLIQYRFNFKIREGSPENV